MLTNPATVAPTITEQRVRRIIESLGCAPVADGRWTWTGPHPWQRLTVTAWACAPNGRRRDTIVLGLERSTALGAAVAADPTTRPWIAENVWPAAWAWCDREHDRACFVGDDGECVDYACSTGLPNDREGGFIHVRSCDAVELAASWLIQEIAWAWAAAKGGDRGY